MGYYLSIPLIVILVAVQNSVLPGVRVANAQPDLVLLVTIAWAVHAEWEEAYWWAILGGLLQDLVTVTPLGTSVIAPMIVITGIRTIADQLFGFNIFFLVIASAIATLLHHTIVFLVVTITVGAPNIVLWLETMFVPTVVMNVALILPVFWVLRRIQKRLPRSGQQSPWGLRNNR